MTQPDESIIVEAFTIRPAMGDGIGHLAQIDWRDGLPVEIKDAGDATHGLIR